VFAELRDSGVVETVYASEHIRQMKLADFIDYVLEARPGCYFVPETEGTTVVPAKENFRATHGYHPDRSGYSSPFMATGAGIRPGVRLESVRIVDLGPTLATLLRLQLPDAEGRVLKEILDLG
jgi:hypothetical protein